MRASLLSNFLASTNTYIPLVSPTHSITANIRLFARGEEEVYGARERSKGIVEKDQPRRGKELFFHFGIALEDETVLGILTTRVGLMIGSLEFVP